MPEVASDVQDQNMPDSADQSLSRKAKLWFCLTAWGGVLLISLAINPAWILAAPIFPVGLLGLFTDGTELAAWTWMSGSFMLGWVLYAVLSAILFNTKSKRIFIIVYLILCSLLVLNVGGCQRVLREASQIQ